MKESNGNENMIRRKLILEDGSVYHGYGFGSLTDKKLELVFNTSMVGYQEILSDPSYTDQAVVMTYPVIGNYGINDDDYESGAYHDIGEKAYCDRIYGPGALIVRDYTFEPSNFRCSETLSDHMAKRDIAGIYGVDTRQITRKIRDIGSCKVMITDDSKSDEESVAELENWKYATDQVSRVSSPRILEVFSKENETENGEASDKPHDKSNYHVVAIDCGIKSNIVRQLRDLGCRVTLVPYDTAADDIIALKPDGVFISNGPGDPTDVQATINTIRSLHGKYPIFGICLGHQILALSYGASTYKLKFGHRGGNHPVKNIETGKVDITSQNHSYAVDKDTLSGTGLKVTHINILDDTVEGIEHTKDPSFGIQYHPESAPGPNDSHYLFHRFIDLMEERR